MLARRAQGRFRDNVNAIERACRITRVERREHLIDKEFISFENDGRVIVSPVADPVSLQRMGVDPGRKINVGPFSAGRRNYLEFHRENVLRMAMVG